MILMFQIEYNSVSLCQANPVYIMFRTSGQKKPIKKISIYYYRGDMFLFIFLNTLIIYVVCKKK